MSGTADQPTKTKDIKLIMAILDTDQQEIASETGIDRAVVSRVLTGQRSYRRARKQIAGALCQRLERLFNVEPVEVSS